MYIRQSPLIFVYVIFSFVSSTHLGRRCAVVNRLFFLYSHFPQLRLDSIDLQFYRYGWNGCYFLWIFFLFIETQHPIFRKKYIIHVITHLRWKQLKVLQTMAQRDKRTIKKNRQKYLCTTYTHMQCKLAWLNVTKKTSAASDNAAIWRADSFTLVFDECSMSEWVSVCQCARDSHQEYMPKTLEKLKIIENNAQ